MSGTDFQNERKWCDHCNTYVRYLMSVNQSYCAECGGSVRLFSEKDRERFFEDVKKHRWQAS